MMEFIGESGFTGGNGAPAFPAPAATFDNWVSGGLTDQAPWATENDYAAWNTGFSSGNPPNSSHDGRLSQSLSGTEPPNKKSRNSNSTDSHVIVTNRSRAIGKMFFKTKLCCKFRAGVCPYITNCNFAHGIEELRKPPPNWQEIVAAHEGERGAAVMLEPREEHQIPTISSPDLRGESQRSSKGRHCKKFYTDEGCPYGENCTFLHDEQSRTRESVAISVTPTASGGYSDNVNGPNQKPSNWKTRICNKWETTGYCPFGSKCHFAHGLGELHKFGEGPVESEGKDSFSASPESKPGEVSVKTTDGLVPSNFSTPHTDIYQMGLTTSVQRQCLSQRSGQKWRGPNKISKIYGDWIDDIE